MAATLALVGFTLIATVTDLWRGKIYNWTTYPGMLVGGLLALLDNEGIGWQDSLQGFVGCGLIMIACFLMFQVGGGDVKLIAMQGAFLGWYHGLECMLWTFVLGAALALSVLIWRFGVLLLIRRLSQQVWWWIRGQGWIPLTPDERRALEPKLHLAPASLAAVLIVRGAELSSFMR